ASSAPQSAPSSSSGAEAAERYLASKAAGAEAPSDLPARRVVPFSDVPAAGPESARPTETTTARSAMTTGRQNPLRSTRWSLIGGAVAALLLLVLLLSMLSGDGEDSKPQAEQGTAGPARVVAAPAAPAPPRGQAALEEEPSGAEQTDAGKTDDAGDAEDRDDAAGESVDLETLPVLSVEPGQAPVAGGQWRPPPKPKEPSNIFNKARNLAV